MFIKVLLSLFLSLELFSLTLNSTYYISSRNIQLQDILPNASYNVTLYKIPTNRYTKRVKSKELVALLQNHGFKDLITSSNYVQFIKKSPIDTSKIENDVLKLYKEKYPSMELNSLIILPRGYIKSLPKQFEVLMQKKAYLSNRGTLSIETLEKKKLFFDYIVDAKLSIYTAKNDIKKADKLSAFNTTKKSIRFTKFRAMPINVNHLNISQSKRNLKSDSIITLRDIDSLNLVKRGSHVSVKFEENHINISFSAKALQNGKLNDIITIQKRNKKRLKAKVIGKNRVEIK